MAKSKKKAKSAKGKKPVRKTRVKSKARAGKKISIKTKPRAAKKIAVKAKPRAKSKPAKPVRNPAAKAPARTRIIGGIPGQLYEAAMRVLNERQAEQIVTVELEGRSSVADYLIVASGRAQRQIAAIADYLREGFMKLGVKQVRIEGLPEANWVLVDAGDVVVHLFRPEVREYYRLEDIWSKKGAR